MCRNVWTQKWLSFSFFLQITNHPGKLKSENICYKTEFVYDRKRRNLVHRVSLCNISLKSFLFQEYNRNSVYLDSWKMANEILLQPQTNYNLKLDKILANTWFKLKRPDDIIMIWLFVLKSVSVIHYYSFKESIVSRWYQCVFRRMPRITM